MLDKRVKARKPLPDPEQKEFDDYEPKVSDLLGTSFLTMRAKQRSNVKSFRESSAVCTLADRQLEQTINTKMERGRVAMYSTLAARASYSVGRAAIIRSSRKRRKTPTKSSLRPASGLTNWKTVDCRKVGAGHRRQNWR